MTATRVLVVTSSLARFPGDPVGAGGNAVSDIVASLGETLEGTVVAPAQAGAPATSRIGGFVVRRVGPQRPAASLHNAFRGPRAGRVLRVASGLRRGVRLHAPGHHVVHAFWAFPAGWAGRDLGLPLVTSFPGSDVHRYPHLPLARRLVRRVVAASSVAVALDPVGASVLRSIGGAPVEEIPHGIRVGDFAPSPPPESRSVVYVGRLAPEKGVGVLLDAVARAVEREAVIDLTVVGDGPERRALHRRAIGLGLGERVRFTGAVPRERVAAEIAGARVVALPSFHEAFPAVALEALAVGRPVVASDVGALPRLLAAGGGRVVGPGDAGRLADALLEVLGRRWDHRALHARAARFDVSVAARRYAALYAGIGRRDAAPEEVVA